MISFREKDYMYSYNKMKPKAFTTHLHRYYEFLYFVSGDATYVIEGREYTAEAGDLFITCPGELHSIVFHSSKDYERHFIQISEDFLAGTRFDFLKALRDKKPGEKSKISHILLKNTDAEACFFAVRKFVVNNLPQSEDLIRSYIIRLLYIVNCLLNEEITTTKEENERVRAAKEYINNNLGGQLKLEKIAEAAYTDRFYLSHLFKRETGINITDYINMQRIALAKKLIGEGKSAAKVYLDCGFKDYSSFYRAVKKLSGKSPTEFFLNSVGDFRI